MSFLFPNVPQLPGVPQVARLLSNPSVTQVNVGLASISNILQSAFGAPSIWGVFTSAGATAQSLFNPLAILNAVPGAGLVSQYFQNATNQNNGAVIQPDSIREFDTKASWTLPNYPIQRGAFASYNKVIEPAQYSFRMVKGGSLDERQTFIHQVETVAASLDLYTVITPERTYTSLASERYEISRKEAPDANFVIVDMYFQQILQATATYGPSTDTSNAVIITALPDQPLGTVTPLPPDSLALNPLSTVGIF